MMTATQKWIVTVATAAVFLYGLHLHDAIMDGLGVLCERTGCSTIEAEINLLSLYVFLATLGIAALLIWIFRVRNSN